MVYVIGATGVSQLAGGSARNAQEWKRFNREQGLAPDALEQGQGSFQPPEQVLRHGGAERGIRVNASAPDTP